MRKATIVMALATVFYVGDVVAQNVDFAWHHPTSTDPNRPYLAGHSGARTVQGPFDLDQDGLNEVLVSDYSGGSRVHVLENTGVDAWELVYSTPVLDETNSTGNGRVFAAGDMDGDGWGEIVFLSGASFDAASPYPFGLFVFEATGNDEFGFAPAAIYDFQPDVPDRWRAEQMHVVDVDGDGLDEVLFGNNGANGNYDNWYSIGVVGDIGSGFEAFVEEMRLSSRSSQAFDPVNRGGGSPYGIVPADLDGDGTTEIAMMSWNNFNFTNARATGPDTYQIPGATDANVFYKAAAGDHVAFFGCFGADVDGNGDDEVYCPNLQTGAVSVLNYEAGENALEVTADNVSLDMIPGLSSLGLTIGDLTGDGQMDLIAGGTTYEASLFNSNTPPRWIRFSSYLGGDVEDPASYSAVQQVNFPDDLLDAFDFVSRDSAGVITEYRESGDQGGEFTAKLAFLGDVDSDGMNEVAISIQGVDDSLYTYSEVFNPADSTYTRTPVSARPNENRVFMRILSGDGTNVFVEDTRIVLPSDYKLSANYPNPFNPTTSFSVTLPLDKTISVKVFDVTGRLVRTIVNNQSFGAGTYEFRWDGRTDAGDQVSSGTYLYTLEHGNFRQSRTMVLLK